MKAVKNGKTVKTALREHAKMPPSMAHGPAAKVPAMKSGGKVTRGCGAATKGKMARGPMA